MCAKFLATVPDPRRPQRLMRPSGGVAMRAVLATVGASLALLSASTAWAQAAPRRIDLPTAWQRSDVVVVAQVLDRTEVTELTVRAANGRPVAPFRRLVRLYQRLEVLRGSAPALLRVDEAQWRARWQAAKRCGGQTACLAPVPDRYIGQVHREPVPGDRVLLFLRKTRDGLEWTADFAVDKAERADEVRRLRVRPSAQPPGGAR